MANMGYLGVGSWFLTYLVTFENIFYLYSVYSDRWDIKGTYNYPKNTHNYPGYGYISKFYPSLDTPGYPLSIDVCLDPSLGFPVFRPFCNIVASVGRRTGEKRGAKNSSQMVVKVQTEVVKDYCFSSLFYMLSNKKVYLLPNFYHVAMPYIILVV